MAGSAGTPWASSAAAFCPRARRSLSGQWQETCSGCASPRPARLPGPYLVGEGALQGLHCLGPINSGNPGAEWKEVSKASSLGLRGCAAGSHGTAAGRQSWKAPCSPQQRGAELGCGVRLITSIFQTGSVMDELLKLPSYGGPRGSQAWPQASWLGGCAGAAPSSPCIRGPLGLPRPPWGGGQGVEPSGCSSDLKAAMV